MQSEFPFLGLVAIVAAVCIYLLTSINPNPRSKVSGVGGIVLINLLLGWTVAGWILTFVWAFTGRTQADERRDEQRHRELLAATREARRE